MGKATEGAGLSWELSASVLPFSNWKYLKGIQVKVPNRHWFLKDWNSRESFSMKI